MIKFEKGDRVIYFKNKYGDGSNNPVWGGSQGMIMGTVLKEKYDGWIKVRWDNGTGNTYEEETLELDPSNDY